jgi:ribonucleoside-triphosphate reductase
MVDAKLIERGLEQARKMHARLGFPCTTCGSHLSREQGKRKCSARSGGYHLLLAEGVKREYALHEVFPRRSGMPCIGDIHLTALVLSIGLQRLPYPGAFKKAGLCLPHSMNAAKPAKHRRS